MVCRREGAIAEWAKRTAITPLIHRPDDPECQSAQDRMRQDVFSPVDASPRALRTHRFVQSRRLHFQERGQFLFRPREIGLGVLHPRFVFVATRVWQRFDRALVVREDQ